MAETVDLRFLGAQAEKSLDELKRMRRDLNEVRSLSVGAADLSRRLDRRFDETNQRISELKDDLELILKAEIGGRLANFETRIEGLLESLREDLPAIIAARDGNKP